MKEHAATVLNNSLPTVKGCIEALAKDPQSLEKTDADTLGIRAVSLAAFGTAIGQGSTTSKK